MMLKVPERINAFGQAREVKFDVPIISACVGTKRKMAEHKFPEAKEPDRQEKKKIKTSMSEAGFERRRDFG